MNASNMIHIPELLEGILESLQAQKDLQARQALAICARVSRTFRVFTERILYRKVILQNSTIIESFLICLSVGIHLPPLIKELDIKFSSATDTETYDNPKLSLLPTALSSMTRLERLRIATPSWLVRGRIFGSYRRPGLRSLEISAWVDMEMVDFLNSQTELTELKFNRMAYGDIYAPSPGAHPNLRHIVGFPSQILAVLPHSPIVETTIKLGTRSLSFDLNAGLERLAKGLASAQPPVLFLSLDFHTLSIEYLRKLVESAPHATELRILCTSLHLFISPHVWWSCLSGLPYLEVAYFWSSRNRKIEQSAQDLEDERKALQQCQEACPRLRHVYSPSRILWSRVDDVVWKSTPVSHQDARIMFASMPGRMLSVVE